MAGLGVFLLCIGVVDLIRGSSHASSVARTSVAVVAGLTLAGAWWCWLDVDGDGQWAWVVAMAAVAAWVFFSSGAGRAVAGSRSAISFAVVATIGLAVGAAAMGTAGSLAGVWPDHGDIAWADPPKGDPNHILFIASLFVIQLSTANFLVRMLLSAAGVPAATNEKHVKGGRWLGPMERLFILGFGVAGEFTAASAVVAAKALLRLPEVNKDDGTPGDPATSRSRIAEHSEYLLLGSFASWLVAAVCIGLALAYS